MRSRTSFAFCGLVRWNFASARNSLIFSTALAMIFVLQNFFDKRWCVTASGAPGLFRLRGSLSGACGVALEGAGGREFAELVTNHVLGDVDRDELAAVVHGNGVADEVRVNGRPAGPGAQHLLVVDLIHPLDLLHEVIVDERTFFR